ncbi:MAG: hypothetical protein JOS17DRAFT_439804 [Linnemannia elongata]|nr:MAG: hypothetical protein JOS17DRAFT_439804 [Linnemannia elongata]
MEASCCRSWCENTVIFLNGQFGPVSSSGSVDGSVLRRGTMACRRRWRVVYFASVEHERWTREEERRLLEAISGQFEGKHQVVVDVLICKPPATAYTLGQLQPATVVSTGGVAYPQVRKSAVKDAEPDCGRTYGKIKEQCRLSKSFLLGLSQPQQRTTWRRRRGRLKEEMFEKDYWRIAEHVGTRSPIQAMKTIKRMESSRKKRDLRYRN